MSSKYEVSEQRSRNMSAINRKIQSLKSRLEKFSIQWDIDSDFIQKIYGSPDIVLPNIKLLSLCMDVSGIGIRIASMLPLQNKTGILEQKIQ